MTIEAQPIDLPELDAAKTVGHPILGETGVLPLIGGLKVRLTARLGTVEMSVAELSALASGAVVALERAVDQPIDLMAEGQVIAQGTLVAVDDHFGLRITSVPQAPARRQ